MRRPRTIALAAALALLAGAAVGAGAIDRSAIDRSAIDRGGQSEAPAADCAAPSSLTAIGPALAHAADRIRQHLPLTIIAVGSSSTLGVGASAPALSYPSRLEAELRRRFSDTPIRVINRGKGGEDAPEELARLERDVVAEHPDLVIWQVGTNAVLRRDDLVADNTLIRRGVELLKRGGSDIVLMDLQYAPRIIARGGYETMEALIAEAAERTEVGLFRRFAIMRYWQGKGPGAGPAMVGPDGLHMSDNGYRCLAVDLAEALGANWRAYSGNGPGARVDQVAGLRGAQSAVVALPGP